MFLMVILSQKKYSAINDTKDSVMNTVLKDGIIDFNVIAKDFLGEMESFEMVSFYRGNYNYIHSLNSANIFAQREGLSFGFIDQHKAPGSDSKLFVLRMIISFRGILIRNTPICRKSQEMLLNISQREKSM